MKQETESFHREEWDFRSQPHPNKQGDDWTKGHRFDFLPEDEVWFCWQYELDRFGPDAPYVLDWRKTAKAQTFNALLEHYWFPAVFGGMNWAKLKVQRSKLKRMNKLKGTKLTLLTACDRHGRV